MTSLKSHQTQLRACHSCPDMLGSPVCGLPVHSQVMLIGQAPGVKELEIHKPFAYTAGKTLFKWFGQIGIAEPMFRRSVYMAAVCRCFPGKNPKGGDRVPSQEEIKKCSVWLDAELQLLQPQLIIPVGKLAIQKFMPVSLLKDVVGKQLRTPWQGFSADIIPLPHPSGASTWHRTEPGKRLLNRALKLIQNHPQWQAIGE